MPDLSQDQLGAKVRERAAQLDAEDAAKSPEQRAREQAEARRDILLFGAERHGRLAREAQEHGDAEAVRYFARSAAGCRRALTALVVRDRLTSRPRPRPRGAGRPRAQATRSSARSGDSPDDDPEPLAAAAVEDARRVLARAARRMQAEATS